VNSHVYARNNTASHYEMLTLLLYGLQEMLCRNLRHLYNTGQQFMQLPKPTVIDTATLHC